MTTPDRFTCATCGGRRTVIRNVPETRTSVTHPDGWNRPPVSLTYHTGHTVERLFQCGECHGRGYVTHADLEQARIDADKAAFEATLSDYIALSHERVAAGNEPY